MAFEISAPGSDQIDPTFMEGYPYPAKYHNLGQLMTPYEGKKMGQGGDYAPPQSTTYYTPDNPVYPYPLDMFSKRHIHLPGESCCCYNPQYPWTYIPGNYFAPPGSYPDMKKVRTAQSFNTYPLGVRPNFHIDGSRKGKYSPSNEKQRERYRGRSKGSYGDSGGYSETGMRRYRRLPTAPGPDSPNSNYYPPFNNFY